MTELPDGVLLRYDETKSSYGVTLSIKQFIEWGVLVRVEPDYVVDVISNETSPTTATASVFLDNYERDVLDRTLDKMEDYGENNDE